MPKRDDQRACIWGRRPSFDRSAPSQQRGEAINQLGQWAVAVTKPCSGAVDVQQVGDRAAIWMRQPNYLRMQLLPGGLERLASLGPR
jgi:hypothetical protein